MNFFLLLTAIATLHVSLFSLPSQLPVNDIYEGIPPDLFAHQLMIPQFDLLVPEGAITPGERRHIMNVNRQVREGNTILNKILSKDYKKPSLLVSLDQIDSLQSVGHKYFLDMVLMPKQMHYPKKAAMIPSFIKFETANHMYNNTYSQFHYYFYIRDLQTGNAYITTRFRGNADVYKCISVFLKQVIKDSEVE